MNPLAATLLEVGNLDALDGSPGVALELDDGQVLNVPTTRDICQAVGMHLGAKFNVHMSLEFIPAVPAR
jgi:hypothetical protein